jgi:uncharacterized membrane protein
MKKVWGSIWAIFSVLGEFLLFYLQNSDIISLSNLGLIIGFILIPILVGILTIGIKYLLDRV